MNVMTHRHVLIDQESLFLLQCSMTMHKEKQKLISGCTLFIIADAQRTSYENGQNALLYLAGGSFYVCSMYCSFFR